MENFSFRSSVKKYVNGSILLIFATVAAFIVANLDATSEWYKQAFDQPVSLSVGKFNIFSHDGLPMTAGAFINDFLMAIFFLSVGLEIKREILCGELSTVRKAMLPVIGACGGMLVPVIVFFIINTLSSSNPLASRGMAIPMATDIAFSLGVLSMFSKRVPIGLKVFLAALAVADDLGGIFVIAIKYTDHLNLVYLQWALFFIGLLIVGNWRRIHVKSFYVTVGCALWYCMHGSGIHATIAGVILAFCVPASLRNGTKFYIERLRKCLSNFPVIEVTHADRSKPALLTESQVHQLKSIESASDRLISPLQDLEDSLKNPINLLIIPLFAFANAGVNLSGMDLSNLFSGVGLSVLLGLLVGKFVGVFSFSWISIKMGWVQLPANSTWKSFASVCMLCGIGFTVSMFMADLSYRPVNELGMLADSKLGILCGSIASALIGAFLLNKHLPKDASETVTK